MDVRTFTLIAIAWVGLLLIPWLRGARAAALLLVASVIYVGLGDVPEPPRNIARVLVGTAFVAVVIFNPSHFLPLRREDRAYSGTIQAGIREALSGRPRRRVVDPEERLVMIDRIQKGIEIISGSDPAGAEWWAMQQAAIAHLRLWLDVYTGRTPANADSGASVDRDRVLLEALWARTIRKRRSFWTW